MTTQILRYTAANLTFTWYTDGSADAGIDAVTIGIVNDDGDTIVAAGTATTDNGDGTYTYAVANTLTGTPDLWTATWTDTSTGDDQVTRIEVVGGWLFTEAEARAWHNAIFASTTTYTDAWIAEQRTRLTNEFTNILGRSPVPRYARETLSGSGDHVLQLKYHDVTEIIAATIGGTAQTVGDLVVVGSVDNALHHTTATWTQGTTSDPRNVKVEYVHGLDTPHDLKRAALTMLQAAPASQLDDRLISFTDGFGNFRRATPGQRNSWFGVPYVDSVLARYRLLPVVV